MMDIIKSTVANPQNTEYEGKDNDEKILYVYRRAFITNISWIFMILVFMAMPIMLNIVIEGIDKSLFKLIPTNLIIVLNLFWYLFVAGFVFMSFTNWFFNIYMITNKKIVDMDFQGLTYKNISEAPLTNIEDVTSNINGTFGTIFNIGSVLIQTAAERTEFEFNDVYNPSQVRDIISDMVTEARKNAK
jgi:hypothetical protein